MKKRKMMAFAEKSIIFLSERVSDKKCGDKKLFHVVPSATILPPIPRFSRKPHRAMMLAVLDHSSINRDKRKLESKMKSDAQLKTEVTQELQWEPTIHAMDIQVSTKDGIVTLDGSVPHYAEKQAAERATQRVEGVKAIVEKLEVNLSGVHQRPDSDVAESVVNALRWHVWVPSHVSAVIENGWVTLTGEVTWGFQRLSAEDAIRFQAGVKGVTNHITLKPTVQPSEIKSVIEKALKRNAEIYEGRKWRDGHG